MPRAPLASSEAANARRVITIDLVRWVIIGFLLGVGERLRRGLKPSTRGGKLLQRG
jgi:hypothetical protein